MGTCVQLKMNEPSIVCSIFYPYFLQQHDRLLPSPEGFLDVFIISVQALLPRTNSPVQSQMVPTVPSDERFDSLNHLFVSRVCFSQHISSKPATGRENTRWAVCLLSLWIIVNQKKKLWKTSLLFSSSPPRWRQREKCCRPLSHTSASCKSPRLEVKSSFVVCFLL